MLDFAHEYPVPKTTEELMQALASWEWRIFSGQLYKIKARSPEATDDDDKMTISIPFRPNVSQRALLSVLHNRNIVVKARQLGFCLDPRTRVLTADLRWVAVDDLRPGDEVIATDENVPGGKGADRKMRTTRVVARADRTEPVYRMTFEDGRAVICTGKHRWLSRPRRSRSVLGWRSIESLTKSKIRVGCQVRRITDTWGESAAEDGWFGGMLDGEGSISNGNGPNGICVSQRSGAVWERLVSYAASRGYHATIEADAAERPNKYGKVPVPKLCFGRMDEMFRLVGQTRPTRFIQNRWWEGRSLPGSRTGTGWLTVTAIEPLPAQRVVDIQTEHGTFVAEGLVSHNSTLIEILGLDQCLFNSDQSAIVIAQDMPSAERLMREKVRYAYDNLPEVLRERMPLSIDNKREIGFEHNGSTFEVAKSGRSGTFHFVHISEMGKMAAKRPADAEELTTGTLQTVAADGLAFIESTTEGQSGAFFDMAKLAEAKAEAGKVLSLADWKHHFFAWWQEPSYRLDPDHVTISASDHKYFDRIEGLTGACIDLDQRAWYVATRDNEFPTNPELMWREYPSTVEEAWRSGTEGKILANAIAIARRQGRIGTYPLIPHIPCNSFWDIGNSDFTAIWIHQHVEGRDRFSLFYESQGATYVEDLAWLDSLGVLWNKHYLPHDADHMRKGLQTNTSALAQLRNMRPSWEWMLVPQVQTVSHGIGLLRQDFATFEIDEEGCKEGIAHLEAYQWTWNTRLNAYDTSTPLHDQKGHSDAADALRQKAQALDLVARDTGRKPRERRRASGLTA